MATFLALQNMMIISMTSHVAILALAFMAFPASRAADSDVEFSLSTTDCDTPGGFVEINGLPKPGTCNVCLDMTSTVADFKNAAGRTSAASVVLAMRLGQDHPNALCKVYSGPNCTPVGDFQAVLAGQCTSFPAGFEVTTMFCFNC
jgi:hypothetical protein